MVSSSGVRLFHLRPPYTLESQTVFGIPVLASIQPVPGSVIAVRVLNLSEWESVRRAFPNTRWKVPSAPFVLWTPEVFEERPRVAFEAAGLGFRGVTASQELASEAMREALGRAVDLDAVVDWLRDRGRGGRLKHLDDIRALLGSGRRGGSVRDAAKEQVVELATLEKRLRRTGWPTPHEILRLGRLLGTLLKVQLRPLNRGALKEGGGGRHEGPNPVLEEIARAAGFANGAHLRRDFRELTGFPPSSYGGTLGWEFAVGSWWTRLAQERDRQELRR